MLCISNVKTPVYFFLVSPFHCEFDFLELLIFRISISFTNLIYLWPHIFSFLDEVNYLGHSEINVNNWSSEIII